MRRRREAGLISATGFAAIALLAMAVVATAMVIWGG